MTIKPTDLTIRDILPEEHEALGQLMVDVYSQLEGFPTPTEQPAYYQMLANIGSFAQKPGARVLIAASGNGSLLGGVVYFADMAQYGSGGVATTIKNASGFRLLGVSPHARGLGVGKALTQMCLQLARDAGHDQVILHTTKAMQTAWDMYTKIGFERAPHLDFMQGQLEVFGFRIAPSQRS
jgi:GNAT superfamily N-acetyltransferase